MKNKTTDLFAKMSSPRGNFPYLRRAYWQYIWIFPFATTLLCHFKGYIHNSTLIILININFSMIYARYRDIFRYQGATFDGYPASTRTFFRYSINTFIPTILFFLGQIILGY